MSELNREAVGKAVHEWAAQFTGKVPNGCTYSNLIDRIVAALAPSPAVAQACIKCGHNDGVDREGICKHRRTKVHGECGCKCEFSAVAQACVKCPHRGKVSAEGFCQHPATICGCKCEFAAVAHPDINNPNARYCEVCTYKLGKATWHLPPLCAAVAQRPVDECPKCGQKGNDLGKWFECEPCNWEWGYHAAPADMGAVTPEQEYLVEIDEQGNVVPVKARAADPPPEQDQSNQSQPLALSRGTVPKDRVESDYPRELPLADLYLWFRRVLSERLRGKVVREHGDYGAVVNSYAAAEIPDWELRQKQDLVKDAINGVNALLAGIQDNKTALRGDNPEDGVERSLQHDPSAVLSAASPTPTNSEEARAAAEKIIRLVKGDYDGVEAQWPETTARIAHIIATHSAALTAKIYDDAIEIAVSLGAVDVAQALTAAKARAAKENQ